jgi:acetyl-CoA carboxylase biotin carboxyl carrier protein
MNWRCAPPTVTSLRQAGSRHADGYSQDQEADRAARNRASPKSKSRKAKTRCASAAIRPAAPMSAPPPWACRPCYGPPAASRRPAPAPTRRVRSRRRTTKGHVLRRRWSAPSTAPPSPGSKPFVEIGSRSRIGEVLCIIEAMKMMNQIDATRPAHRGRILVKTATPVEFDQPLFVIE